MHLLRQVGPAVGLQLIGSGKPAKEPPAEAVRLFIQRFLLAAIHRLPDPIVNSLAIEEDSYTRIVEKEAAILFRNAADRDRSIGQR